MPIDPSISLGVQPVKMPNVLEMALQGQALKNQFLQGQGLQQNLTAQNAIGRIIQKNVNPDGSVNNAGVQHDIANDPDAAFLAQAATGTNQAQTGQQIANQSSQFKLHNDYATVANQTAAGLMVDPRINGTNPNQPYDPEQASKALAEAQETMVQKGVPREQALTAVAPFMMAVHQPGQVQQMLKNVVMGSQTAPQQMTTATPQVSMVPTIGANGQPVNQPTNVNPNAGPIAPIAGSTAQPMTMAPSELSTIQRDPNSGNLIVAHKTASGNITSVSGAPIQGENSDTVITPPMRALQPGEKEQIPVLAQQQLDALSAYKNAAISHTTNQGILRELKNVSATGEAGPILQRLNSTLGGVLNWSSAEKKASSFDEIGKYVAMNNVALANSMGLGNTDAGRAMLSATQGSTKYNPTAIQNVTKTNDALTSGTEMYYPGLQKAIQADPSSGSLAKKEFDADWASVFRPEAMMLYNAKKSGDTEQVNQIIKNVGGAGSKGYQDLLKDANGMFSLMQTGKLPK